MGHRASLNVLHVPCRESNPGRPAHNVVSHNTDLATPDPALLITG
jgi:hypothetical protein